MKWSGLKKEFQYIIVAIIVIFFAFVPLFGSTYAITLSSTIMMYIVMASCWNMFSGPAGYISLASGAFVGLGFYASGFLSTRFPLPVLMLAGGLASLVLAVIIGSITLRLRGVYFTIFTFCLVELVKAVMTWYEIMVVRKRGLNVRNFGPNAAFYAMLVMVVIALAVVVIVRKTRFGMALTGIGESEDAAAHIGINTTAYKVSGFAVTAFMMGTVGAVRATMLNHIDPTSAFNMMFSFLPVLMCVFGGMNTFLGPIIGAIVFAALQYNLITKIPQIYMIIFGAIMILSILFMPTGIVGVYERVRKAIENRKIQKVGGHL
ncbi:MAG: branched-chain amino acid ABC transporter permease [Clostridiales bacterium]|mgnify:CR=1 FL=1|jgi:branched-chain amino acid transport system permease protein|nr:branched-chain amino acid ABC transporter permease [Clostridiales bacterium]